MELIKIFNKVKSSIGAIIVIALILELTVFNFRFYESIFFKEQTKAWEYDKNTINVKNVDCDVKNIYLNLSAKDKKGNSITSFDVTIYATDEGHEGEYKLPTRTVVTIVEKSKYINMDLSGECKSLRIVIDSSYDVELEDFSINKTRCFDFNILRLFLCMVAITCVALLKNADKLQKIKAVSNNVAVMYGIMAFALINVIIVVALCFANDLFTNPGWAHHYQYQELSEALASGQLSLLKEPPEYLETMENPYDYAAREAMERSTGETYRWDTAYYEGKYYVYFGVVPALIFYLPVYLLTGLHSANNVCIAIMAALLVYGIMGLIYTIIKKYYKETSLLKYLALCQAAIVGCNLWYMAKRPDFYTVPIIMGIMFSIYGIWFWLLSIKKDGKINIAYMVLGSLCMALVAGCRPQLVLASALGLVIYVGVWKKKREVILFFIPYVVVAIGLMRYNNARFGSVFDFGSAYNLTVDDMTNRGLSINRIALGLYAYIIQPFSVDVRFPYFSHTKLNTYYQGYTSSENPLAGIFVFNLYFAFSMFAFKAKSFWKERRIHLMALTAVVIGVVLVLADTQLGGIYMRYTSDFSWVFAIAAVIGILAVGDKISKNAQLYNIFIKVAAIAIMFTVGVHFVSIFTDVGSSMKTGNPELFYYVAHAIEFWL